MVAEKDKRSEDVFDASFYVTAGDVVRSRDALKSQK